MTLPFSRNHSESKMLDEIRQQPIALEQTLRQGAHALDELSRRFDRRLPNLVILAARGTSDNAAQFGRYLIEITTGIPVSLAATSTLTLYHAPLAFQNTLVVGVSQSGESTDTNAYLEEARRCGAVTVGVTNEPSSIMTRIAHHTLLVQAGPEESVAATKTYTGQMLAMYQLASALGGAIRQDALAALPESVEAALELEDVVAEAAWRHREIDRAAVVGRGLNYSNALEFGLKLMETCYVSAERFSAADFMHGPVALLEPDFPLFLFAPPGATAQSMDRLLRKATETSASIFRVTDRREGGVGVTIPVQAPVDRHYPDLYTPIPYIVPAQLFSAHLAAAKGLNPDQPRSLSKVTKTM
jgi:glucosamine--fructose-6-phosphate aminotransferase (isomerizing)